MPGLSTEDYANIKAQQNEAKAGKMATRKILGSIYDQSRSPSYPPPSAPQSPQDHPANNVGHPHGNRGRSDATLPLGTPMSWPSSTGEYQDYING